MVGYEEVNLIVKIKERKSQIEKEIWKGVQIEIWDKASPMLPH